MKHRNCNGDSALNAGCISETPCICVCASSQQTLVWCQAGTWLCSCVDAVTAGCTGWAGGTVPVILSSWHLEQVNWLPDTKHRNHARLLSVATDGKILVWKEERDGRLALAEGFAIVAQQVPRSTRLKKVSPAAQRVLSFHKNTLNPGACQSSPCSKKGQEKPLLNIHILNPQLLCHMESFLKDWQQLRFCHALKRSYQDGELVMLIHVNPFVGRVQC